MTNGNEETALTPEALRTWIRESKREELELNRLTSYDLKTRTAVRMEYYMAATELRRLAAECERKAA